MRWAHRTCYHGAETIMHFRAFRRVQRVSQRAVVVADTLRLSPLSPRPGPLGPAGTDENAASTLLIAQQWQAAVDAAAQAVLAECRSAGVSPDDVVGVYLRGSIPRGTAVSGISDCDMLAYYLAPPSRAEQSMPSNDELRRTLRRRAAALHSQFPFCAKFEMDVYGLDADSSLGRELAALQRPDPPSHLSLLAARQLPRAHQLATASVTLHGVDLPCKLPSVVRVPHPQTLLTLMQDCETAEAHVAALASESTSDAPRPGASGAWGPRDSPATSTSGVDTPEQADAVRAARWALKRCIRAGFELVQEVAGLQSTRDLYWCATLAEEWLPALERELLACAAHQRFVEYAVNSSRMTRPPPRQPGPTPQPDGDIAVSGRLLNTSAAAPLQCGPVDLLRDYLSASTMSDAQLHESLQRASSFAARINALFTLRMLQPERGLRSPQIALPRRADVRARGTTRRNGPAWLLRAAVEVMQLEEGIEGAPAGAPAFPVTGSVRCLDWASGSDRAVAMEMFRSLADDPAKMATASPVVLRNAAQDWPAVKRWTLRTLAREFGTDCIVRAAPCPQFVFLNPSLAQLQTSLLGERSLPVATVKMSLAEWVLRSHRQAFPGLGQLRRPLVYARAQATQPSQQQAASRRAHDAAEQASDESGRAEWYYLQSDIPAHMLKDLRLHAEPFPSIEGLSRLDRTSPQQRGEAHGRLAAGSPKLRATQQPRLWLSPPGAVSPMHYDNSASFLVQVRGRKRMLFVPPSLLQALYPYPPHHMLARRSRVDVEAPDLQRFPLFEQVQATEAELLPGDVVFFGPFWSHYTQSVTCSASVTWRFAAPDVGGA